MLAGTRANLAESYVAAEQAYRAALALQQKALGENDPNTAVPLMLIALQVSDQGRSAEADAGVRPGGRAGRRAPPTRPPRPAAALPRAARDQPATSRREALPLLREAEARYAAAAAARGAGRRPPRRAPLLVAAAAAGRRQPDPGRLLVEPAQQAASSA